MLCERELTNLHDRYAIAVIKDGNVIWRLFTTVGKCDDPSDVDDDKAPLGSGSPPQYFNINIELLSLTCFIVPKILHCSNY